MNNNEELNLVYYILMNQYLKKKDVKFDIDIDLKKISSFFPEDWFVRYSIEERIQILKLSLNNNVPLVEALNNYKQR